jgi:hypothetical protein
VRVEEEGKRRVPDGRVREARHHRECARRLGSQEVVREGPLWTAGMESRLTEIDLSPR